MQPQKTLALDRKALLIELIKREFSGRYHGSFGGVFWSFVQPLFLLLVYTIAFGVVFKARWGFSGGTSEYALMLFAGLIIFDAFAECLSKAPGLIVGNSNYVKKIVFPLEMLSWVTALVALAHVAIGVCVWLLGYVLLFGWPQPTVLFFPLVLACCFPMLLGIGWLVSALGVMLRDTAQVMAMFAHSLLFLTPIFFSLDVVPESYRRILLLNPLTFLIEQFRRILFRGEMPDWLGIFEYFVIAILFALTCRIIFRYLRPAFADLV